MKKLITMAIIGFVAATTAPLANAAGTAARREAGADAEAGEARCKTFVGAEGNNCLKDVKAAEEKAKATHEKAESDIKRMKN